MKFSGKVGNGSLNKWLNFGANPDHRLDTEIVFRIRHYWEIRKVVNGHKSAAHTDSPDTGTGKTCLGGGMHCPSAFSSYMYLLWPPCVADADIIFLPCGFYLSIFFLSSPNLSGRRMDVYTILLHMVWP